MTMLHNAVYCNRTNKQLFLTLIISRLQKNADMFQNIEYCRIRKIVAESFHMFRRHRNPVIQYW